MKLIENLEENSMNFKEYSSNRVKENITVSNLNNNI